MIGPADERVRAGAAGDAVTFAFGDAEADVFGLARTGLQPGSPATASALALVFSDGEVAEALAEGEVPVADPEWESIEVAGVRMEVVEPLAAWRLAAPGGVDLRFSALSPPIELQP